jgi:hypothetical protein
MTDELVGVVGSWGERTFPDMTQHGILQHLTNEATEELSPGCDDEELADVSLLTAQLMRRTGGRPSTFVESEAGVIRVLQQHVDQMQLMEDAFNVVREEDLYILDILIQHCARLRGIDLNAAITEKFERNQQRRWSAVPNEHGYHSHISDGDAT